jgi:hypothetical protein
MQPLGQLYKTAKNRIVIALLTVLRARAGVADQVKKAGKVNADDFCTLPVLRRMLMVQTISSVAARCIR